MSGYVSCSLLILNPLPFRLFMPEPEPGSVCLFVLTIPTAWLSVGRGLLCLIFQKYFRDRGSGEAIASTCDYQGEDACWVLILLAFISHEKLQLHEDLTFNIWHTVTVLLMYEINRKQEQYVIAILCRYILNSMFCKTLNTVFHVQILQAIELQAKICEDFL